jgi:cell volume regulation protein A
MRMEGAIGLLFVLLLLAPTLAQTAVEEEPIPAADPTFVFLVGGVILFIGYFGEIMFKKTNVPDVILLLFFGILLGVFLKSELCVIFIDAPTCAGYNRAIEPVSLIIGTLALVIILFEGGLNMDLHKLLRETPRGLILALSNFVISVLLVGFISHLLLDWELMHGLLLGVIVGGTTSAIIIPIVSKIKIEEKSLLILTIESAVTDVLCIVFALTLIGVLAEGIGSSAVNTAIQTIVSAFSIGILLGLVAGLFWLFFIVNMEKHGKSYMVTLAALLILYVFTDFIGGNGAIACLVFGVILGNVKTLSKLVRLPKERVLDSDTKFFYSQITFFVKSFFFVYLGLIIDLSNLVLISYGLLLTVLLLFTRPIATTFATFGEKFEKRDTTLMNFLVPRGLAAAVLAQAPASMLSASIPGFEQLQEFPTIVMSVIFFTILASSVGVYVTEKYHFKGYMDFLRKLKDKRDLSGIQQIRMTEQQAKAEGLPVEKAEKGINWPLLIVLFSIMALIVLAFIVIGLILYLTGIL